MACTVLVSITESRVFRMEFCGNPYKRTPVRIDFSGDLCHSGPMYQNCVKGAIKMYALMKKTQTNHHPKTQTPVACITKWHTAGHHFGFIGGAYPPGYYGIQKLTEVWHGSRIFQFVFCCGREFQV